MSDRHQELVIKLAALRKLIDEATLGPWWVLESPDAWTLHGEAREFRAISKRSGAPSMQILKAAKHGTPYAEYWPNAADGKLIVDAVNFLPFFLSFAEDVVKRHHPVPCTCGSETHFLCAEHRMYAWDDCPDIAGLIRMVDHAHV